MANFCTNCGKPVNPEWNFCSNCGTPIEKESQSVVCGEGQRKFRCTVKLGMDLPECGQEICVNDLDSPGDCPKCGYDHGWVEVEVCD
jgi:predicted nucleic acid-binding Zn ribbon protein